MRFGDVTNAAFSRSILGMARFENQCLEMGCPMS